MRERFNNMFAFARHMLVLAARAWVCEAFLFKRFSRQIVKIPIFIFCHIFQHIRRVPAITFPTLFHRALFFGRKAFWSSLNFGRSRDIYRRRRRLQSRVGFLLGTKHFFRSPSHPSQQFVSVVRSYRQLKAVVFLNLDLLLRSVLKFWDSPKPRSVTSTATKF